MAHEDKQSALTPDQQEATYGLCYKAVSVASGVGGIVLGAESIFYFTQAEVGYGATYGVAAIAAMALARTLWVKGADLFK